MISKYELIINKELIEEIRSVYIEDIFKILLNNIEKILFNLINSLNGSGPINILQEFCILLKNLKHFYEKFNKKQFAQELVTIRNFKYEIIEKEALNYVKTTSKNINSTILTYFKTRKILSSLNPNEKVNIDDHEHKDLLIEYIKKPIEKELNFYQINSKGASLGIFEKIKKSILNKIIETLIVAIIAKYKFNEFGLNFLEYVYSIIIGLVDNFIKEKEKNSKFIFSFFNNKIKLIIQTLKMDKNELEKLVEKYVKDFFFNLNF